MSKRSQKRKAWKRNFYAWSRLLHIYISAALFALLIFFSITGYFLNHLNTFGGSASDGDFELQIPAEILSNLRDDSGQIYSDALLVWLKQNHGLSKMNSLEYDADMAEVFIDYSLPAGYASVILELNSELYTLEYRRGDTLAIWNDLHKGRHTGAGWSWVIDLSALFIVFFAITGFILIFQNKKQRRTALVLCAIGTLTPVVLYYLLVPRLIGV